MRNFNTNQTRNFYVALAIDGNVDTNGDIALKQTATGEMYFSYKNGDGLLTRSDTFDPKKVVSVTMATAASMATKLKMHTVAVDTTAISFGASSPFIGKTFTCTVTFHQFGDQDDSSTLSFVASVVGNSTNLANATAFHKALAIAIAKALPKQYGSFLKVFSNGTQVLPTTPDASVTGAAAGVVLVEAAQKYVRGKFSGEPVPFSVSFRLHTSNDEDIIWGSDTVADSNITGNLTVPANYALADLEYFALGERGDVFRGYNYPNDYTPTYLINPATGNYNVLSIQFYWNGNAENVQKSPRLIQVAAPATDSNDIVTTLYDAVVDRVDPSVGLETRIEAIEKA